LSFTKYVPQEWKDGASGPTFEATAAKLAHMEAGVLSVSTPASVPTAGANGTVKMGTSGVSRCINAVIVGDGTTTTWKLPHELETLLPSVTVWHENSSKELVQTAIKDVRVLTNDEVELTFSTAPASGAVYWVQIDG